MFILSLKNKIICIKDDVKPCARENKPDHMTLNVRTNKLSSEQNGKFAEIVAEML